MRKTFLIILLSLLTTMAATAQSYTAQQARQRINASAAHMNTMRCDFVQTKTLKMLKSKVESKGVMYYSKADKLRWEYTSPYRYVFIINGQTVWLKNSKGNSKVNVAQSKMFKEITRIMMSSVLGTCVSDNNDFRVSLQGKGNSWQAVMTPRRNPMKQMFRQITVCFDMGKAMVESVRMVEKNGDTTLITLKNVKVNTPVNAQMFSIH